MHGHRWIVNIEIGTDTKHENDMIIDFTIIKNYINEKYDHRILNRCPFPAITDLMVSPFKWGPFDNPTAENIAEKIAEDIFDLLPKTERTNEYVKVELFESPKSSVIALVTKRG